MNHMGVPTADGRPFRAMVLIESDIVYRHFIKSHAFADLVKAADVRFVFAAPGPGNKRLSIVPDASEIGAPMELLPIEPERIYLWRRLFQVSQLVWRPGSEWKHLRTITRYFIGRKAAILFTVLALPGIFQLFRWWTRRNISSLPSKMDELVGRLQPDVLIHPTVFDGYFVNDFVLVGRQRGIPTVAIMNSWDNPSTKRTVVDRPDCILVWGPQTKAHTIKYMKASPDSVVSFGAAQFDVYRNAPRVSREQFCREHGIDPGRRVLLYAGSSKGTDEFEHLRMIEAAIDAGELSNLVVLYRPHPWGDGGYKGERLLDYPWRHVVIENSMRGYLEDVRRGQTKIYFADYAETHTVLSSVDALVSPLSTIILEGALHGIPVLCFMPEPKPGSSFTMQSRLVHFDDMYKCPAFLVAHGDDALIPNLRQLVERVGDATHACILREASAHFVTPFERSFSERIVELVGQVVGRATITENARLGGSSVLQPRANPRS